MITGFNTDVEYEGRIFHVQTEDKGRDNPVVESLVYSGGEILTKRRTPYDELARSSNYSEEAVTQLMGIQHQALIREINNGKFDPEGPKPFGYNIITNRSLDEVVAEFLSDETEIQRIRLEMENHQVFVEGTQTTVKLRVISDTSQDPVEGIRVAIKIISTNERPKEIFAEATDSEGRVAATLEIPELDGADAAILCQAEAPGSSAELKQLIRKSGEPT